MKSCPICKSDKIKTFVEVEKLPLIFFPVPKDIRNKIHKRKLKSYLCKTCSHIFKDPINSKEASIIYGRYYLYYPFENLESMNSVYRQPFKTIFEHKLATCRFRRQRNQSLLEIGCSSGKQLEFYKKYGIKAYGIDPSPLTKKSNKNLISGFYEDYRFPHQFDFIVSRFHLEHTNDIGKFLRKVKIDLKDNGFLFIQVPNVQTFAKNLMPFFLAHEHIHYFNIYSLYLAAIKNGFKAIMADYREKQSIVLVLQKNSINLSRQKRIHLEPMPASFYNKYAEKRNILNKRVKEIIEEKKPLYFYGSGLTLCWIFYELDLKDRLKQSTIIDDNGLIRGKYLPHTINEIKGLNEIKYPSNATLILTLNPVYHNTVIHRILSVSSTMNIYAINQNGVVSVSRK